VGVLVPARSRPVTTRFGRITEENDTRRGLADSLGINAFNFLQLVAFEQGCVVAVHAKLMSVLRPAATTGRSFKEQEPLPLAATQVLPPPQPRALHQPQLQARCVVLCHIYLRRKQRRTLWRLGRHRTRWSNLFRAMSSQLQCNAQLHPRRLC
jgi:hypothetical protein